MIYTFDMEIYDQNLHNIASVNKFCPLLVDYVVAEIENHELVKLSKMKDQQKQRGGTNNII